MKIIRVDHRNQSANRVFQYLLALRLAELVEGARVVGYDLDIFGVRDEAPAPPPGARPLRIEAGHNINLGRLAWLMNSGVADDVTLWLYGMRMEYLPDPAGVRKLLQLDDAGPADDCLYLHVRGGDILQGVHPDYFPLPIAHYREVIAASGLRPVFLGQIDDSAYCRALRASFPEAEFMPAADPLSDFRTLMRGRHVAMAISSFSWLASWISPVAEQIFQPVAGLFHPMQRSDVDLLPLDDPRYRFRAIPPRKWAAGADEFTALLEAPDRGAWATPEDLRNLLHVSVRAKRAPQPGRTAPAR
jgi:hypothetical protein